jgi:hypothetical protein
VASGTRTLRLTIVEVVMLSPRGVVRTPIR